MREIEIIGRGTYLGSAIVDGSLGHPDPPYSDHGWIPCRGPGFIEDEHELQEGEGDRE